jgi:hypothetical protein
MRRSSGDRDDAPFLLRPRLLVREIQDQPMERNNWVTRTKAGRERTTPISVTRPSSPYQRDPAFVGFTNGLG